MLRDFRYAPLSTAFIYHILILEIFVINKKFVRIPLGGDINTKILGPFGIICQHMNPQFFSYDLPWKILGASFQLFG